MRNGAAGLAKFYEMALLVSRSIILWAPISKVVRGEARRFYISLSLQFSG